MSKKDINKTAFDVVRRATGQVIDLRETTQAQAGRKGGIKGGSSRAKALAPERRLWRDQANCLWKSCG